MEEITFLDALQSRRIFSESLEWPSKFCGGVTKDNTASRLVHRASSGREKRKP